MNQLRMQQEQEQLQALQMKGIGAKPVNTGTYQVLNFDPIIQAMTQKKLKADIEAKQKKQLDLTGAYQSQLADALKGYHASKRGETQVTPLLDEGGQPVTNQLPGDPRAFRNGQSSPFAEVRKLAEKDETQYNSSFGKLLEKGTLASGVKAVQNDSDIAALAPKPEIQVIDGQPYNVVDGKLVPAGHKGYTQEPDARGGIANRNTFNGKVETRGGQTINVGGAAADTEYLKEEGKAVGDQSRKLQEAMTKGFRALASVEQASQKGAIQGPVASWAQFAVGLAQQFGLNSDRTRELLTNTEVINGGMGRFVLELVKATGTNPSNTDLTFTKETAGGKELSPDGLAAVIRAARVDIINSGLDLNAKIDMLKEKLPSIEMSRLKLPSVMSMAPAAKDKLLASPTAQWGQGEQAEARDSHNIYGFMPSSDGTGRYGPTAAPKATPPTALTPAERKARLKALGIPE
jgi:hypothetical protein